VRALTVSQEVACNEDRRTHDEDPTYMKSTPGHTTASFCLKRWPSD